MSGGRAGGKKAEEKKTRNEWLRGAGCPRARIEAGQEREGPRPVPPLPGAGSAAALVACPEPCGGGCAARVPHPGAVRDGRAGRCGGAGGRAARGCAGVGGPGAPPRPAMQIEGAGRGRCDSEPRKRGETPYKNYWGPFPARTTKAPETAAACGGSERGGLLGGAGRPLRRRGAASAPAGARRAVQAAALQVGHLPLSCSTTWLRGAFSPPTPHFMYLFF